MGFFGNLLKSESKKFISSVVGSAIDGALNAQNANTGNSAQSSSSMPSSSSKLKGKAKLIANLEQVLANEYSTYEVKKNVSVQSLFFVDGAVDYSYVILRNGAPASTINIIENRSDYRLKRYRLAKEAAVNNGIPHMNFFAHLPNEMDYISNRIKQNIIG